MCHSLESLEYLKFEKRNFIQFECEYENKIIKIIQQYKKKICNDHKDHKEKREANELGNNEYETKFTTTYKLKIWNISLRDTLLLSNIYLCKTQSERLQIV